MLLYGETTGAKNQKEKRKRKQGGVGVELLSITQLQEAAITPFYKFLSP
jgi:hypothetical protein